MLADNVAYPNREDTCSAGQLNVGNRNDHLHQATRLEHRVCRRPREWMKSERSSARASSCKLQAGRSRCAGHRRYAMHGHRTKQRAALRVAARAAGCCAADGWRGRTRGRARHRGPSRTCRGGRSGTAELTPSGLECLLTCTDAVARRGCRNGGRFGEYVGRRAAGLREAWRARSLRV